MARHTHLQQLLRSFQSSLVSSFLSSMSGLLLYTPVGIPEKSAAVVSTAAHSCKSPVLNPFYCAQPLADEPAAAADDGDADESAAAKSKSKKSKKDKKDMSSLFAALEEDGAAGKQDTPGKLVCVVVVACVQFTFPVTLNST